MKPLIYALIIIMIVDAFLLAYFIVRTTQKKRLKNSNKQENLKTSGAKQGNKESDLKVETPKKKNKLTKHSSYGKIKVNEEALRKILEGYDKDEEKKEVEVSNNKVILDDKSNAKTFKEENLDAVFEDFKIEEKVENVEDKKTPIRFRSPFHNVLSEKRNIATKKEEIKEIEEDEEDEDFDTSDIEKAYQDFLMRKKQEYLKKYEQELEEEDEEDVVSNNLKSYTINDFKDDYFIRHKDIDEIVNKLSDEDKNKILSILLSKNTLDENDFID